MKGIACCGDCVYYDWKKKKCKNGAKDKGKPTDTFFADCLLKDVAPVVHGKNITELNPVDEFVCSECGFRIEDFSRCKIDEDTGDKTYYEYEFRYCPNCGAKMDLEDRRWF